MNRVYTHIKAREQQPYPMYDKNDQISYYQYPVSNKHGWKTIMIHFGALM